MKYTISLPLLLLSIVLVACKKAPVVLNSNYIPVNDCRSFDLGDKTLRVCLDSVIQDSRCPINAICIWEGVAVGRFSASAGNESRVITLATAPIAGYSKETIIEGFKIEFIELSPHAILDKPFNYDDYVAEVRVTKQ